MRLYPPCKKGAGVSDENNSGAHYGIKQEELTRGDVPGFAKLYKKFVYRLIMQEAKSCFRKKEISLSNFSFYVFLTDIIRQKRKKQCLS